MNALQRVDRHLIGWSPLGLAGIFADFLTAVLTLASGFSAFASISVNS